MNKSKKNVRYSSITNFSDFVFRTPIYSVNNLDKNTLKVERLTIIEDKLFEECLFLVSPSLLQEVQKYKVGKLLPKEILKLKISLLKYISRMSTRCTPFGLFAGCGIGCVEEKSSISICSPQRHISRTRLDMDYLCSLIHHLSMVPIIKKQANYYPNNTLYSFGETLRYVSYKYVNSKKRYLLEQVEKSNYLDLIINRSTDGVTIKDLLCQLADDDISITEGEKFIETLIENQILVSDLEPTVTGEDVLKVFIEKLEKFSGIEKITDVLRNICSLLSEIDSLPLGSRLNQYGYIKEKLQNFEPKFQEQYLFQSDLLINVKHAKISKKIIDSAQKAISVFLRITPYYELPELSKFKKDFYKRYEEEEVPLGQALDIESGVGFGIYNEHSTEISDLLEGLIFPNYRTPSNEFKISPFHQILIDKYEALLSTGKHQDLVLTYDDISSFSYEEVQLPDTFSAMIEVISTEEESRDPHIIMRYANGYSASRLTSRFGHLSEQFRSFVKNVSANEESYHNNKIVAEVVHLPESRTGNVILRPILSKYEIPYLTNCAVVKKNKILINDLMISVPGGKYVKLRSKSLDMEVIPRLSSAHNFSSNSLPLYHFLCALQGQGKKNWIGFNWGPLFDKKPYLPRVRYENIIFSPAIWNITISDICNIPEITDKNFYNSVLEFKKNRRIPDKVLLVKGDNKLFINFKSKLSTQMLFSEIKKRGFQLEEFIQDVDFPLVHDANNVHTNQIILSFYNNHTN